MSALLDSLAIGFHGDAQRREALASALADGLPSKRNERWKYTSLRALEQRSFALAAAAVAPIDATKFAGIPAPRLVFVNGQFDAVLSDFAGLPDGVSLHPLARVLAKGDDRDTSFLGRRFSNADETFAKLNAAFAHDGALLRVAQDVHANVPVHLVFLGAAAEADIAWHARSLVELRRGASLIVVEHHLAAGDHAHFGNSLIHVHLAAGAQLKHARVQHDAARATSIARTDAVLARDARYRRVDLELGAGLSRHELNVRLEGEGARLAANGVLLADGNRHVDTRLGIEHIARNTACDLTWRGLASGRGRAVFHGGIAIRAGAYGSDARLSNKNLLLSAGAEIDAQPVLEIHADEVKAAHGATVGTLDETAMFYLRSRGLPLAQARGLLVAAFCREPLRALDDAFLTATLEAHVDAALAQAEVA